MARLCFADHSCFSWTLVHTAQSMRRKAGLEPPCCCCHCKHVFMHTQACVPLCTCGLQALATISSPSGVLGWALCLTEGSQKPEVIASLAFS